MAGMKALVSLAFTGSIGMTFVILACALPEYKIWWPMTVLLFYLLVPLPTMSLRANRHQMMSSSGNMYKDFIIFITMGLVISSYALPIVMMRSLAIKSGACLLTLAGNTVMYLTYAGFFLFLYQEDDYGFSF